MIVPIMYRLECVFSESSLVPYPGGESRKYKVFTYNTMYAIEMILGCFLATTKWSYSLLLLLELL